MDSATVDPAGRRAKRGAPSPAGNSCDEVIAPFARFAPRPDVLGSSRVVELHGGRHARPARRSGLAA